MKRTGNNNTNYPGGKGGDGTYQQIINHIPPHKVFVSPFAGKCGIFRNVRRANTSVLNDIDPDITNFWRHYLKEYEDVIICENFIQMQLFGPDTKKSVILRNNDALSIINRFANSPDTFIYCDPPYPMVTRKSKRQLYAFEFADREEHEALLKHLQRCNCNVMISTYENDLYNHSLLLGQSPKWYKHSFAAITRNGMATECIYMNYPPPVVLHDFRYLGNDFRERERIKKKVNRHRERLRRLPDAERTAILSSLIAEFNQTVNTIIEL